MKKLTRRAYNRKVLMFGAAIFMSVAMISTGFAAWLISSADPVTVQPDVSIAIVTDQTVKITVDNWDPDAENPADKWTGPVLNFDADKADTIDKNSAKGEARDKDMVYFTGGDEDGEQMTLELKGTVTNVGILDASKALTVVITVPDGIAAAIKANYLKAPTGYNETDKTITKDIAASALTAGSTDNEKKFDASVTFEWGTAFGSVNPCYYYDSAATADKDAETVVNEMTAFSNMIHELEADADLATDAKVGSINVVITPNLATA